MSKAKETELEQLHAMTAKMMAMQLSQTMMMEDDDGNKVEMSTASPALFGQVIKFLKDNKITADPETDQNLSNLKEALEKKQKKGRLYAVNPQTAAGED